MRAVQALIAIALALDPCASFAGPRSAAARAEFQRLHPCPDTGAKRGACPGWQVDHIVPLKCNGLDAPGNMQWLTVHDHKLKTKREAHWCRKKARPAHPGI